MKSSRREFLGLATASVLLPRGVSAGPPLPRYRLAMNLELMFPEGMPYPERMAMVAQCGARHYGFWDWRDRDLDRMAEAQERHGLSCLNILGSPRTGWNTGLTRTGHEQEFLDDFAASCGAARRLGASKLITFVGAVQEDIDWPVQRLQVVQGLKKAGEIAREHRVKLLLEPLNRVESPEMSVLTTEEAFSIVADVDHAHVRVDFDVYHRQLGEGNILNTLREGLDKGLVDFVEVGSVPGRKEPGSGELDYTAVFSLLRRLDYSGYIGMEHGTTSTPQHAWDAVRRLAGFA